MNNDIAIIGISLRLPEAKNINEFWQNLIQGKDSIRFYNNHELNLSERTDSTINNKEFKNASGYLEDMDKFDASFFNYSHNEAKMTDPQHRHFLQCSWEALEDSGYLPSKYSGKIGVFAGAFTSYYLLKNIIHILHENMEKQDEMSTYNHCTSEYLTTNVAYRLDLTGPSVSVQTGCSTGLSSIHIAKQAILRGECDLALAGAVHFHIPQEGYFLNSDSNAFSKDGKTRAYDKKANGTVPGNGVAVVVLKKLSQAVKDGDDIYAVVKGSCINNDGGGSNKLSHDGISQRGIHDCIKGAIEDAKINAGSISYIEGHGLSTQLTDRIELDAIAKALLQDNNETEFCGVGSVKTNIGHLGTASSIASLIKTTLAIKNKKIPPSLNFETLPKVLAKKRKPYYIVDKLKDWNNKETPLRAGVNSFANGGTNAHIILEESPVLKNNTETSSNNIITFSAKTKKALNKIIQNFAQYLLENPNINISDLAYTTNIGRDDFEYRLSFNNDCVTKLTKQLEDKLSLGIDTINPIKEKDIVFMFPGYGEQYQNMGLELYESQPVFKKHIDECAKIVKEISGQDILHYLYPENENSLKSLKEGFDASGYSLFAFEYALAKLLISFGIIPKAILGYSQGEYVAACIAEIMTPMDALKLMLYQGKLLEEIPEGRMLAIPLSESEVKKHITTKDIDIAAINGPEVIIVSGTIDAISDLKRELKKQRIECLLLDTKIAYHSHMLEPILERLNEFVANFRFKNPKIPILSTVTGAWVTENDINDNRYWAKKVRQAVVLEPAINELFKSDSQILLEIGPRNTLKLLTNQNINKPTDLQILSVAGISQGNYELNIGLYNTIRNLWENGIRINWENFYSNQKRRRIHLPTYPFEKQKFWISPKTEELKKNEKDANDTYKEKKTLPNIGLKASKTEICNDLHKIWLHFFGNDKIKLNDDFLSLGGHSLLAVRIINKIIEQYDVEIKQEDLFNNGSVTHVAEIIFELLDERAASLEKKVNIEEIKELSNQDRLDFFSNFVLKKLIKPNNIQISLFGTLENDTIHKAQDFLITTKAELGIPIFEHELKQKKTVVEIASFLNKEFEIRHQIGLDKVPIELEAQNQSVYYEHKKEKNSPAIFLHSAPRSGSTLFRIMLEGNTNLFCPPELRLLPYANMKEWNNKIPKHVKFHGGVYRCLKELLQLDDKSAKKYLENLIDKNIDTQETYRLIQKNLNKEILVDKCPHNSIKIESLKRAERIFDSPKYIFLVRHPYAVIDSYIKNRIYAFHDLKGENPYHFAERDWYSRNRNLVDFFSTVEQERWIQVRYEDLVKQPEKTIKKVCRFLGIEYQEAMILPYDGNRMMDGDGDPNIFNHSSIDPKLADVWMDIKLPYKLEKDTEDLAKLFSYKLDIDNNLFEEQSEFTKNIITSTIGDIGKLTDEEVEEMLKNFNDIKSK